MRNFTILRVLPLVFAWICGCTQVAGVDKFNASCANGTVGVSFRQMSPHVTHRVEVRFLVARNVKAVAVFDPLARPDIDFVMPRAVLEEPGRERVDIEFYADGANDGRFDDITDAGVRDHTWVRPDPSQPNAGHPTNGCLVFAHKTDFRNIDDTEAVFDGRGTFEFEFAGAPAGAPLETHLILRVASTPTTGLYRREIVVDGTPVRYALRGVVKRGEDHVVHVYSDTNNNRVYDSDEPSWVIFPEAGESGADVRLAPRNLATERRTALP